MMFTPSLKSTIYLTSILLLSGLGPVAAVNLQPSISDTSNSANKQVELQAQMGCLSTGNPQYSLSIGAPLPGNTQNSVPESNKTTIKTSDLLSLPINLRRIIPVTLESVINSKLIRIDEDIIAKLKEDLYYGRRLIAPANSILKGHVRSIRDSRTLSQATFKREDRFNSNAALEIVFESICTYGNYSIPITGRPAHQESTHIGSNGLPYGLTVNRNGKITQGGRTLTNNQKNAYNTLRVATIAPLPGGLLLNLGGTPMIMATVGAISPDVAFNRPIENSVKHRRLKGMGYGFVTSLPGAFFVQSVVEKGSEIILCKGDEIMLDITISNQIIQQPVMAAISKLPDIVQAQSSTKAPEALTVKAELLEDIISPKKDSQLPLKPPQSESIVGFESQTIE